MKKMMIIILMIYMIPQYLIGGWFEDSEEEKQRKRKKQIEINIRNYEIKRKREEKERREKELKKKRKKELEDKRKKDLIDKWIKTYNSKDNDGNINKISKYTINIIIEDKKKMPYRYIKNYFIGAPASIIYRLACCNNAKIEVINNNNIIINGLTIHVEDNKINKIIATYESLNLINYEQKDVANAIMEYYKIDQMNVENVRSKYISYLNEYVTTYHYVGISKPGRMKISVGNAGILFEEYHVPKF